MKNSFAAASASSGMESSNDSYRTTKVKNVIVSMSEHNMTADFEQNDDDVFQMAQTE
jgi:hypothetical protein